VQLATILKVSTDELPLGREPRGAELEISDVHLRDKFQRCRISTSAIARPSSPSSIAFLLVAPAIAAAR
jgi:hypothetical protein